MLPTHLKLIGVGGGEGRGGEGRGGREGGLADYSGYKGGILFKGRSHQGLRVSKVTDA